MNISVGYYLHVIYFYILYYKNLVYYGNIKANTKIASGLLTKAIFLFCLIFTIIPTKGFADTIVKANNEDDLNLGASWIGATPPAANDIAHWDSTVIAANTTILGADTTWQGILITNPGGLVTINAGNTLTLGAAATDIDMTTSIADLTLNCNLMFNGDNIWDVTTGRTLTVDGDIANSTYLLTIQGAGNTMISGAIGAGSGGLTKVSSGTLTLSGVNTYTGTTTVSAGTLAYGADDVISTGAVTVDGGTLDISSYNDTVGTVTLAGGSIAGTTGMLSTTGTFEMQDGTVSAILGGAVDLNKTTAGTVTLSGANIYTGLTTLTDGTLNLMGDNTLATGGVTLTAGTLNLGTATALGTGTLTIDGGTIDNTSAGALTLTTNNAQAWGGNFAFGGSDDLNLGTGAVTLVGNRVVTVGANTLTVGGAIGGAHSLTKAGAGTLTLNGVNTYTGLTTISAGTLNLNEDLTTSSLAFSGPGTVNLAADKNITGNITNVSGGTIGILNYLGNSTTGGNIGSSGIGGDLLGVNIQAGTLTMNHNIFAGTTILNDAAAVDISSNNLTIGGALNMIGSSRILLDILNSSTSGSITVTGAAGIPSTVLVDLNITSGQYIPHGTTYAVIDGTGGVVAGGNTITDNIPYVSFTATGGEDLILVASRVGTGFDNWALTDNSRAAGRSLEDAGFNSPSGDMQTVLNTMEALQASEIEGALNQMIPQIDRGIIDVNNAALNQNVQAMSNHLKYKRTGGSSGVSTGDEYGTVNDVWIKAFGTYTIQNARDEVEGYRARIAGAAIGADILARDNKTAGLGLGYSNNNINSRKTGKVNTAVDSLQLSFYYGYDNELGYVPQDLIYFDLLGSFAWNAYDASRTISFSSINRSAKANYDGQQYTMYAEAGYHAPVNNTTDWIPFISLQYTRLNVDGYTEKNAGALSLNVDSQAYNTLELGFGMKLASKIRTENFDLVRELRFRWLYDLIADNMETTSRFTGGGAAFTTKGARPSRHTFDVGGSLGFITNKNFTVDFDYDYSMKEDHKSHDGSAVLKFGILLP
jgi:autotransporter-associated beta strand protein